MSAQPGPLGFKNTNLHGVIGDVVENDAPIGAEFSLMRGVKLLDA